MSIDMMDQKVKELRELRRMQEELASEIEAIQDELKAHMDTYGMSTAVLPAGPRLESHLEGRHQQPFGQHRPKKGAAGHRRPLHEKDHRTPVRAGMKKAPCITAGQSTMQGTL